MSHAPRPRVLVLGPLDLRLGPASLGLGAPRQRSLLARLAIARGHLVPVSTLVDDLWGEQPPATVVNAIQVYVAGLRKLLGPAGLSATLVTQSPGYRLMLPDGALDLDDFERAHTTGAAHAARGDAAAAAGAYRAALDQWRGPALADLDHAPFTATERSGLEDTRVAAAVGWLTALVNLGDHDVAVPGAERELASHPLHEGLWALRATALYQAGRQADALSALRRARRLLAHELGVDPGPALLSVERRILGQDPALGPRATPRGRRSSVTHVATSVVAAARLVLPDGRRVPLGRRDALLGRHDDCAVVLDHRDVSRRHALVTATVRGHGVQDLGSTNGTAVNGERLESGPEGARLLRHGDRIEIGPLTVRYEAGVAPSGVASSGGSPRT